MALLTLERSLEGRCRYTAIPERIGEYTSGDLEISALYRLRAHEIS